MADTTHGAGGNAASGRFLLRIDPGLHEALRAAAREAGLSLNEYCGAKLAAPGADPSGPASRVVRHAASTIGGALVGVVAYGSWARGEAVEGSDIDVLLVLAAGSTVTRQLYRDWDRAAPSWDGHQVEPHVARLPAPDDPVTGLWAEVAVDGIVLFERGLAVSRHLARVRRRIATGELTLRHAHGQPYWVGAA
jgi:hypothetical protein